MTATAIVARTPEQIASARANDPLGEVLRLAALRALKRSRERLLERISKATYDSSLIDKQTGEVVWPGKSMRADGELASRALRDIDAVISDVLTMKLD